jgi:hypothetical protein
MMERALPHKTERRAQDEETHFATPKGCVGHRAMFNVSVVQGCSCAFSLPFLLAATAAAICRLVLVSFARCCSA